MKRVKTLFAVGIPGVLAAGLVTTLVYVPQSASAQTSNAASYYVSPSRIAARARASKIMASGRPVSGAKDPSLIPNGWTSFGNSGTDGADGVVPLSPAGNKLYEWVSTSGGLVGVGALPTGKLGSETNGSTLSTPVFSATAGAPLSFYFDYVTADGAGYADYGWAELFTTGNTPVALLFTARTVPTGSVVPGTGMPSPLATLTPSSVPIQGGFSNPVGPVWSPLGVTSSGYCYMTGCGYTGWIKSDYTIPTAGNYYLELGVTNWLDRSVDTGLAMDGVTVNGIAIPTNVPAGVPVPTSLILTMLGLAALGAFFFASQKFARS